MPSGRIAPIDDPAFAKSVALAYVEGATRKEMAEMFGVKDLDTITRWCRDPRVRAHAAKFAEERVMRIVRKTDSEIENRMANIGDEDIETILKIRKEYLGNSIKVDIKGGTTAETVNDTMEAIDEDPEMAKELMELLAKANKGK